MYKRLWYRLIFILNFMVRCWDKNQNFYSKSASWKFLSKSHIFCINFCNVIVFVKIYRQILCFLLLLSSFRSVKLTSLAGFEHLFSKIKDTWNSYHYLKLICIFVHFKLCFTAKNCGLSELSGLLELSGLPELSVLLQLSGLLIDDQHPCPAWIVSYCSIPDFRNWNNNPDSYVRNCPHLASGNKGTKPRNSESKGMREWWKTWGKAIGFSSNCTLPPQNPDYLVYRNMDT